LPFTVLLPDELHAVHGLVVLNTSIPLKTWLRERGIRQRAGSTERDKRNSEHTGREAEGRGDLLASRRGRAVTRLEEYTQLECK